MKKALLIGAAPLDSNEFINYFKKDEFTLIAIDGGYEYCIQNQIVPDILVGDFDTFPENKVGPVNQIIMLNPIKDDTDTFYIIKKLINEGYEEFYIFGCLGGKLDHTIANIQILRYLTNMHKKAYLFEKDKVLFSLSDESISFSDKARGFISIFSLSNSACTTIKGLKYNVTKFKIDNDIPIGISNEFIGTSSSIEIQNGAVILYTNCTNLYSINN